MASVNAKRRIPLGSGYIYAMEFTGEIPANADIEKEENRLGYIEKGATVEYKPTATTLKDDYGIVSRTIVTEEEATLKLGLISWDYDKMDQFCSTARVTEANGVRTVKVGGAANDSGKRFLFRFVHPDSLLGSVRVTVAGINTAGFSLAYTKDDATRMEPEITAEAIDADGTLIIFEQEMIDASPANLQRTVSKNA